MNDRIPAEKAQEFMTSGKTADQLNEEFKSKDVEPNLVATRSILTKFSDIPQKSVPWLWHGWLVEGALHILAGAGSTGKTTLALSLASIISTGGEWPDGTSCEAPGNILIWSSEDDPAFTLGPRLVAAGADLDRCHYVGGNSGRPFDPATDLQTLEAEIQRIGGAKFLLIDPIVSVVQGEGNSNPQVRRSLQPLVDLGQKCGCAILGISHFNKGGKDNAPMDRVNGSLAYAALARVVMSTVRISPQELEEGDLPFRFVRTKGNLAADSDRGGFKYGLEEVDISTDAKRATRTKWGSVVEGAAADILRNAERPEAGNSSPAHKEAEQFLREVLADGPVAGREILAQSRAVGIAEITLRRAGRTLGIKPGNPPVPNMRYAWTLPVTSPDRSG